VDWVLFGVGAVLALLTVPALVPVHHWALLVPAFMVSWIGTGLAGFWLVVTPVLLAVPVLLGGLDGWPGWVGLGLGLLALSALLWERALSRRAAAAYDRALTSLDARTVGRSRRRPSSVLAPFWMGGRGVERVRGLRYADGAGRRHLLDVYRPRPAGAEPAPVLLQIHGGAWTIGTKDTQGRPLMQALTAAGWVCVAINYRLAPRTKIQDQLVDCKHALQWIRGHIAEHGGDPDRVVVTGGSAGGHLAALVALSANDPRHQPGFETVDTSVIGCVPMYGAYDLEEIFTSGSRLGRRIGGSMGARVLGVNAADDPEAYRAMSPVHAVRPGAPPFLVVHGTVDNLVPVEQARRLVAALREVGTEVTYVELAGAPHAFDVFHSEWADAAVAGTARWLGWLLNRGADGAAPAVADSASSDPTTMARTAPSSAT
jgi:acetyl esterase/lipase